MAVITAKGDTELGYLEIKIIGTDKVTKIESPDDGAVDFFSRHIDAGDGEMANGYHPDSNTMLQAFAFCSMFFNENDITVDGDIGQIEHRGGVVY